MSNKDDIDTEKLVEEFLDKGGEIEKLPAIEDNDQGKQTITNITSTPPKLMDLTEGQLMFGEKRKRRKKKIKQQDIDWDLIPEHLRNITDQQENSKE